MQKSLSLIIAVVIIYYIVQMKFQPSPEEYKPITEPKNIAQTNNEVTQAPEQQELTGNFLEKSISKVVINALKTEQGRAFFENLIQPKNQSLTSGEYSIEVNRDFIQPLFRINTLGTGTEGPATCGQVATIHYQILDTNNNLISEETKTFTLGSRSIIPGIDIVTTDMKIGQTRQAIIPAKYAYNEPPYKKDSLDPDASYRVNIVLNSILPNNFIDPNEVKIFDDEITYKIPLLCGDRAEFDAKITRLSNGEVLYDSKQDNKNIVMKIGDITYPLIVSYALHGKVPVGTRTVIAKGQAFKAPGSNINRMLNQSKIPNDEYLMLELTNFKNVK
ncbi:MAG: FKBP-type peptidyl-prolyl cis-trans isomerase [Candidatus Rickettsia vulgarisii]